MPNVILNKANGRLLTIPAGAVVAIIAVPGATKPPADHAESAEAASLVFTTFRGFTSWWLQQTPRAVMEAVKAAEPKGEKRPWVEIPSPEPDQASFLPPGSVTAIEGEAGDEDGEPDFTRVWFTTPNGQATSIRGSADSAVVESLQADMEGKTVPPQPRQPAPAPKASRAPRKR